MARARQRRDNPVIAVAKPEWTTVVQESKDRRRIEFHDRLNRALFVVLAALMVSMAVAAGFRQGWVIIGLLVGVVVIPIVGLRHDEWVAQQRRELGQRQERTPSNVPDTIANRWRLVLNAYKELPASSYEREDITPAVHAAWEVVERIAASDGISKDAVRDADLALNQLHQRIESMAVQVQDRKNAIGDIGVEMAIASLEALTPPEGES